MMSAFQAMALVAVIFILCWVLAPLLLADMPSFRYGINLGDVLDILIRLVILGLFLELLRRVFSNN